MIIVTGGAGAYLYEKAGSSDQDPHLRAHASVHHHCLLTLAEDAATLETADLTGQRIDQHAWHAAPNR